MSELEKNVPGPLLFISDITEEARRILKVRILKDFPRVLDVFVSSDVESIDAGNKWLPSIAVAFQCMAIGELLGMRVVNID